MSRYNLLRLFKYHNSIHRLTSRLFDDRPVIIKDDKSYIYSRKDKQITWIYHDAHIHIYINKIHSYCLYAKALQVHVHDIVICVWFDKAKFEFSTKDSKKKLPERIRGSYFLITSDPVQAISDLYHKLVHEKNLIYAREIMDKNNIKYV
jgi:hypothetical protein